jgi:hypothetical protein
MLSNAMLLVGLAILGYGCSEPVEEVGLCPQPGGEFAAYSCAVLDVQVVGMAGEPLPDVSVYFYALRDCGCNEFGTEVDQQGRFRHTVHRFEPADSTGDTVTVMVRAAATGRQYPQPTDSTFVSDSTQVVLQFRPIGVESVTSSVEIRLPLP